MKKDLRFIENNSDFIAATQPLIKWPGGKRSIVSHLAGFVPLRFGRYFECFVGGGALFFHLKPPKAVLSDSNADLINLYKQVRERPQDFLNILGRMKNNETSYYRVRASRPTAVLTRAARTFYLASLSFNGIYRTNLRGEFNVPYGGRPSFNLVQIDRILHASRTLRGTILKSADFEEASELATRNDVVYFDPPYTVAHGNNGFIRYNERIFSWCDQERLALHAKKLARRGCRVIVTNADHPSIQALYSGFAQFTVQRASMIAAESQFRGSTRELILVSGG